MDKLAVRLECMSIGQSDNCTGPSLNYIKTNVPQSNFTWRNKSNLVTVTVFGKLYKEKNTTDICGEASVLLSVLPPVVPTLVKFLSEKQHLLPALPTEASMNFPPEHSLRPPRWQSQIASSLDGDYVIM